MPHRTTYVGTVLPNPISSIFEDMGFSFLQKETSQSGISIACVNNRQVRVHRRHDYEKYHFYKTKLLGVEVHKNMFAP